jgi:Mrp family chromosome partitioning ATPase/DUF971 family protein
MLVSRAIFQHCHAANAQRFLAASKQEAVALLGVSLGSKVGALSSSGLSCPRQAAAARCSLHTSPRSLSSAPAMSPRDSAAIEEAAQKALRSLAHPLSMMPLAMHPGCVRRVRCDGFSSASTITIKVDIEAFSPAALHWTAFADAVKRSIYEAVRYLSPDYASKTIDTQVRFVSQTHDRQVMANAGPGLKSVGSVIAVSSGKGGVGKSTVAVNLAFALAARGSKVGILDADIHGPSLPTMVNPPDLSVRKQEDGCINALDFNGVKMMSYGWVAPRNTRGERTGGAMRGPMTSSVLSQLLKFTSWGSLDHLVIDMPPGTGDVHVTLGQTVPIATAVVVTTPQKLALADVAKGLDLFATLRVPTATVVLNMSYYEPKPNSERLYPFGNANSPMRLQRNEAAGAYDVVPLKDGPAPLQEMLDRYGIGAVCELPIDPKLAVAGDSGIPFVVAFPNSPLSRVYDGLAADVAQAAERNVHNAENAVIRATAAAAAEGGGQQPANEDGSPSAQEVFTGAVNNDVSVALKHDAKTNLFTLRAFTPSGASTKTLTPFALRLACKCAGCVDEATGVNKIKEERIPKDIRPAKMTPQGNYGVAIEWSDGHDTGIYTFEQLYKLV